MSATSTYMTFLMVKKSGATNYTKLVDIKEFPDMGGDPEQLETTTLSEKAKTYINGLQDQQALKFVANYDYDEFGDLKDLEGVSANYAVWFGGTEGDSGEVTPTGSLGKFTWTGELTAYVAGKSANNVRETNITISASTVISFE